MKKIQLGDKIEVDIDVLLRTRMLVQANSGGGKSWLLRRLAEQLFGIVQVIIIDKEGEFSTLREKYGYVLIGEGGETPADPRSASLVAEKLLELKASAVCDLFESFRKNPQGRHLWVKNFCNALLDAPKKFWHPLILIIDEFHTFVPEKGAGESEASESVIGIGTAGRKRGYCLVGATQRLGKVRKDVTAELLNRLVGPTFEDLDLDRAADLLSIPASERKDFYTKMRLLEPGNFFALGRALCKERTLFKVGPVKTTHPEMGKYTLEPPPPPEKVKALLPQLRDLPKQAEDKARTIADLSKRIRELEMQLRLQRPRIDESIVTRAAEQARVSVEKQAKATIRTLQTTIQKQQSIMKRAAELLVGAAIDLPKPKINVQKIRPVPQPRVIEKTDAASDSILTNPEQRILDALAWFESIGIDTPEQPAVAFLAGYKYGGGAYNNPRGSLRVKRFIEYVGDRIRLTDEGRLRAHQPQELLTDEELHQRVLSRLPTPEQRLLRPLIDAYPNALTNEELATASGYKVNTGGYNNPRGRLRTLGLIEYTGDGRVKAKSLLFPSGMNAMEV